MLESDGSCVLVGWQDSSDSDGLVTDDDRLLVAGVGDHGRVIINIRVESDTYNGRQCNNFMWNMWNVEYNGGQPQAPLESVPLV
mgnify:CR=1 FL=1